MNPEQLRLLLSQPDRSGVYRLPSGGVDALRQAAESLGFPCFTVNFGEAGESSRFGAALETLGRGLGFPRWYGANLDALHDCLCDFSWNEAPGYIIILSGAESLRKPGEPFMALNRVFASAILEWRRQNVPFWIFYDTDTDDSAFAPALA